MMEVAVRNICDVVSLNLMGRSFSKEKIWFHFGEGRADARATFVEAMLVGWGGKDVDYDNASQI
ncbi:unnamed protein product [Rhodiola kirilowii]